MKKLLPLVKLLFTVVLGFSGMLASAQSTGNYTGFVSTKSSLALDRNSNTIDMSTGTTPLLGSGVDDTSSPVTSIGFDFFFMKGYYNQFGVSDNGILTLGTIPGTTVYALPNATVPTISAFANDMRVGTNGAVISKVVGSAPNRTLVVQWSNNMIRYLNTAAAGTGTWQVRLYETTGVIEYVYGAMATNVAAPTKYFVGFSNNTTTNNVITIDVGANSTTTSATVNFNTYSANSIITDLNSTSNGNRKAYFFVPPGSAGSIIATSLAPPTNLTFASVTGTGMTLNWTASTPTTGILAYAIYNSTDNVNFTYAGQVPILTNSYAASGLIRGTTYYWKVYPLSEGTLGTALAGNATTLCTVATNTLNIGTLGTYNWNTASWSLGHAPYPCENVVINGSGAIDGTASVVLNSNVNINSLKINLVGAGNNANRDILGLFTGIYNLKVTNDIDVNNTSVGNGQHYIDLEASANGSITCNNMTAVVGGIFTNNNAHVIFIESYGTININGTTTANATNLNGEGGQVLFNVGNSPAQFNFNGNAVFDSGITIGKSSVYVGTTANSGNTSGKMVFKGDATFGGRAFSIFDIIHGVMVFDAVAAQTVTIDNPTQMFFPSVKIGEVNSPAVTFAGLGNAKVSSSSNSPVSVLVSPNSVLNLADRSLNLNTSAAASFNVSTGASLKLGGSSGGQTGSNFPLNFGTIILDPASTVEYSGAVQTIYNSPTYGNLTISGTAIKTLAGNTIAKNVTVKTGGKLTINANQALTVTDVFTNSNTNNLVPSTSPQKYYVTIESDGNLLQTNNVTNVGDIAVKRNINLTAARAQYNYLSSPIIGGNLKDSYVKADGTALANLPQTLYYTESNNKFYTSSGVNISGRALAVKEPAAADFSSSSTMEATFKGVPYNGPASFTLVNSAVDPATTTTQGYNLLGNPYPSNLDLITFYNQNNTGGKLDPTFYLWDSTANSQITQAGSGYGGEAYARFNAVVPPITGTTIKAPGDIGITTSKVPTRYVKSGQGFMAKTLAASLVVNFANTQRASNAATGFFGKGAQEAALFDRYWLSMSSPSNLTSQIAVVYFEGGDDAYTKDDSYSLLGSDAIYCLVDNQAISINGKASFASTDKVILGSNHFVSGNYTIALDEQKDGVFAGSQSIYLKDKQTGIVTNLSEGNYTFTANAGESTGRFEIIYQPEVVLSTGANTKENLIIYRDANDFVVKADSKKITDLEVYDSSGRMIYKMQPNNTKAIINADRLNNGVYVLKVNQSGEITSKKVIK